MESLLPFLKYAAIGAFVYALVGLAVVMRKARSFGKRVNYAAATGSEAAGIRYAFVEGMMPWEKDSARKHLATYVAGVFYHIGIFAALVLLLFSLSSISIMRSISVLLAILSTIGCVLGLSLFIKRSVTGYLRAISHPDDFVANLLVDLFLLLVALSVFKPEFVPALYILSIVLLLYVPIGKIRHCCLFFASRVTFGRYFGRRSVLPHPKPTVRA
jgi:hypothetical protein